MSPPPACAKHRALVDAAMSPEVSDEVFEQYAAEVPSCEACQRALARDLQVHPVVLDEAVLTPSPLTGMVELYEAMRETAAPTHQPWRVVAGFATLAAAAAAAWLILDPVSPIDVDGAPLAAAHDEAPASPGARPPSPVEVDSVEEDVAVAAPNPSKAPARPTLVAPRPTPVEPPPTPEPVVAQLTHDWPPPPFVELRGALGKGSDTLRSAQLVLGRSGDHHQVGDLVELTVVSSSPATVGVCVNGPERGVVWRGGIPAGRVALSTGGDDPQLVSFSFAAPGTYRFALATEDLDGCSDPVHVVEVEVNG